MIVKRYLLKFYHRRVDTVPRPRLCSRMPVLVFSNRRATSTLAWQRTWLCHVRDLQRWTLPRPFPYFDCLSRWGKGGVIYEPTILYAVRR
jgi:hypothetical protein